MTPRRVFSLALATQGVLIAIAWGISEALGQPARWSLAPRDIATGLGGAFALAVLNYVLLTRAPANWLVDGVRTVYHEVLVPLFARLDGTSIIILGAAAGVGEEWLFRGVLQPRIGWIAASILFGLVHIGGARMLSFGVWATGMGLVLGGLAQATGSLTAPVVAHGLYDILALEYIRRGAHHA